MKKVKNLLVCGTLAIVTLSSCSLTTPVSATSNPVGKKVGTSTAICILNLPPFIGKGNTGIQKAVENGKITKISTVDYTVDWFILFTKRTCTVTGE
jgi:hypothetical protein